MWQPSYSPPQSVEMKVVFPVLYWPITSTSGLAASSLAA